MPFAPINGVRLWYQLSGTGEPLVLVHGSWGDHHGWDAVAPVLARSFRVLVYDRRGHSESERRSGQLVADHVEDLAGLIEHHKLAPAHVAGNSLGAAIGLKLAARRPDLFRSLVAHEPPLAGMIAGDPIASAMVRAIEARLLAVKTLLIKGDAEGAARRFVEEIAFGPDRWRALTAQTRSIFVNNAPTWLDEANDPDALQLDPRSLAAFDRPALLTEGDHSPPMFSMILAELSAALPHARRRTFVGAGHVPHLTHPERYVATLTKFVRETEKG